MKILIADPAATMRRIIASMLQQLGYQYIEQVDVTPELSGLGSFDLVIADYSLALLPAAVLKRCIVIYDADVNLDQSAAATLQKPFSADMLAEKITAILNQQA